MIPLRLELKNFLAYRSPDPIIFSGIHLACLTGPNGAGKSSILDAITWALWGEARTRRDDDLVHLGQNEMYVQLDFEQDGTVYRVLRQRMRSNRTGKVAVYTLHDGELETKEEHTRQAQEFINTLLRMDYHTFVHSAFLQQGRADAFTSETPAERKKILSNILGLEQWAVYEDRAKERLSSVRETLRFTRDNIAQIDQDLMQEPALIEAMMQAEVRYEEIRTSLDHAEAALKKVENAQNDLAAAAVRLQEITARIHSLQADQHIALTDVSRVEERLRGYETIIAQQGDIEAGYGVLQQAQKADTELGDRLKQLRESENIRAGLMASLIEQRAALESEAAGLQAQISELLRTKASAPDETLLANTLADINLLESRKHELNAVQETTRTLTEERATLLEGNRQLRGEMNEIKERMGQVETLGGTCPLCGQPLDEHHREQLYEELKNEGTQRGNTFRAQSSRIEQIDRDIKALKQQGDALERDLENLPALSTKVGAMQAQVKNARESETRLVRITASHDKLLAVLNNEDFAQDIRVQLAAVNEHITALGYDDEGHNEARRMLNQYRGYDARRLELDNARKMLPAIAEDLERAQARAARIAENIAAEVSQHETLEQRIGVLEVQAEEQRRREGEAAHLRSQERAAYEQLSISRQNLDSLDKLKVRKQMLEERVAALRIEEQMYDELKLAFGKNGIPAMIIEAAIPELEDSANRLLGRMTGGRMALALTTQREKVTGGTAETLEIQIADELGARSYETYSGGEAFRVNFALRVALSQMLARRAGAELRTLFIDEGFGTQDEEGRDRLVEAINAVQDDFQMILIITHIDELRDAFPVHIEVQKTPQGSQIRIR